MDHFWCPANEWALSFFQIVFEKQLRLFLPLREQMDPNTHINIRPSCNYCWHGYSSCMLLNNVATQWGKHLVTKINDKVFDKAHYYKLSYVSDANLWQVWENNDHKKLDVTVKSLINLIRHGWLAEETETCTAIKSIMYKFICQVCSLSSRRHDHNLSPELCCDN